MDKVQPGRKHLILYILDVPYFFLYTVLYKIVASIFYFPLFLLLNLTQVPSLAITLAETSIHGR